MKTLLYFAEKHKKAMRLHAQSYSLREATLKPVMPQSKNTEA